MYIVLIAGVSLCFLTIIFVMLNGNNILSDLNQSYLEKREELEQSMDRIVKELMQNEDFTFANKYKEMSLSEKANMIYHCVCEKNDSKNKLKLIEYVKIYNNFIDFYKSEVENNHSVLREEKILSLEKIIIDKQAK